MSLAISPLGSAAWTLFLGLATATSSPPISSAKITLNEASCDNVPDNHATIRSLRGPEQCVQVKDTKFKSLQFFPESSSWPVCGDWTFAELLLFDSDAGCDPNKDDKHTVITVTESYPCVDLEGTGSFSFWCDDERDSAIRFLEPEPEDDVDSQKDQTKEGGMLKYSKKGCNKRAKPKPEYHLPDTCVDVNEGLGLSFTRTAVCANGTNALITGFKGKGCDPTDKPLSEPFTKWSKFMAGFCIPTDGINSMTFWCDGLEGVDMEKPNRSSSSGNLGLIIGLSVGLGSLLFIVMGLVVAYNINYHFRMKVKVSRSSSVIIHGCTDIYYRDSSEAGMDISPCKTGGFISTIYSKSKLSTDN